MTDKNEVKALLARAGVEVSLALDNLDNLNKKELDATAKKAKDLVAFFDFNGSCGSLAPDDLVAFFDFNVSCGSQLDAINRVIALSPRRR